MEPPNRGTICIHTVHIQLLALSFVERLSPLGGLKCTRMPSGTVVGRGHFGTLSCARSREICSYVRMCPFLESPSSEGPTLILL